MEKPSLDKAKAGAFRFNTDSSQLEIYDGNQWAGIVATSAQQQTGATRGFWAGGEAPSKTNVIQFVNIETTGDTVDFGDASYTLSGHTAFSSRTRGLTMGGSLGPQPTQYANTIEFVTMSSQGNSVDFGDSTTTLAQRASLASSTRGVMIAGLYGAAQYNIMDYVTIAQTGNGVDFGDLPVANNGGHALSSPTRGIYASGYESGDFTNAIRYITISTLGNGADFGDLTRTTRYPSTSANAVRGVFAGGANPTRQKTIDFITIATLGDALDFGDLSTPIGDYHQGAASPIRGCFGGGNYGSLTDTIQYVQIMTTGDAIDFGNLLAANQYCAGFSNGHGGL